MSTPTYPASSTRESRTKRNTREVQGAVGRNKPTVLPILSTSRRCEKETVSVSPALDLFSFLFGRPHMGHECLTLATVVDTTKQGFLNFRLTVRGHLSP